MPLYTQGDLIYWRFILHNEAESVKKKKVAVMVRRKPFDKVESFLLLTQVYTYPERLVVSGNSVPALHMESQLFSGMNDSFFITDASVCPEEYLALKHLLSEAILTSQELQAPLS